MSKAEKGKQNKSKVLKSCAADKQIKSFVASDLSLAYIETHKY
jgi:hypothetical protein